MGEIEAEFKDVMDESRSFFKDCADLDLIGM